MSRIKLLSHQQDVLEQTAKFNRVGFFLDMQWDLVKLMLVVKN